MLESWEEVNFVFVPYKDTEVSVMGAPDEVQMMLDDHIVKTTTMKNSPFIGPFEKEVNAWDERLVSSINTQLLYCNTIHLFLKLYSIFSTE